MTEVVRPSLPLLVTAFLKPDLKRAGPFDLQTLRSQTWGSKVIPTSWIQDEKANGKQPTDAYLNFLEYQVKEDDEVLIVPLLFEGEFFCRVKQGEKNSWDSCVICGRPQHSKR